MNHNYKIDDIVVFHFDTGYCETKIREEIPIAKILNCKTQEELDAMSGSMIDEIINEYYESWLLNFEQGWFIKDQKED